jgi:hypothetical protein
VQTAKLNEAARQKVQDWSAQAGEMAREAARVGDQAASIADHATDASRDAADVARDTATEIAHTTASVAKRAAERLHDAMPSRAERDTYLLGDPAEGRLGSHLHSTASGIFAIVNSGRASWLRS